LTAFDRHFTFAGILAPPISPLFRRMTSSRASRPGYSCLALVITFLSATAAEEAPLPVTVSLADAIQATLAQQPGVEISRQQVLQRQGNLQSASGRFDWVVGSFFSQEVVRTPTGSAFPLPGEQRQDISVYGIGAAKQLRNGISISPEISVVDAKDSLSSPTPISQSDLSLTITVPLLRGLGVKVANAEENAARAAADAQQQLSRYQLEQMVFQTTQAYWNCLAALRNRDLLLDSARRAERILEVVEIMARGGELDSAQRNQARALVSSRRALSEEGELTYFQSRQGLALAMGLTGRQLAVAPDVAGEFPTTIDREQVRPAVNEKYISEALGRRGDYLAASLAADAQQLLLDETKGNLKPRLDFRLRLGYAGDDRRPDRLRPVYALSNNLAGANALGSLSLEWPVGNNVARGALVTQRARVEEARLNLTQAANGITASVLIALETLRKTLAQYELSARAVQGYQQTVVQTNEKMNAGEASLNELIDVEDRYAEARRGQIAALRTYAITLAQLRLLTGTLSTATGESALFEVSTLTTVPFAP
jgi:outer membrane protein